MAQGPRGSFAELEDGPPNEGSVLRSIFIRSIAVFHSERRQSPSPLNASPGHQRVLQGLDPPKTHGGHTQQLSSLGQVGRRQRLGLHTDMFSYRARAGWQFQITNKPCTSKSCKWFLSILDTSCGLTPNKQRSFGKGEGIGSQSYAGGAIS